MASKACMDELDKIDGIDRDAMLDLAKEDFGDYYKMENRDEPDFLGFCLPCMKDCTTCQGSMGLDEETKTCKAVSDCEKTLGNEVKAGKCVKAQGMKFRIKDKSSKKVDDFLGGEEKEFSKKMYSKSKGKME